MTKKSAGPMAGLPKDIRVGPHTVKLSLQPPEWGLTTEGGVSVWGQYSDDLQEIRMRADCELKTVAVDTIVHEIMHAIYATYYISPDAGEEATVRKMATGLTQVMRDSPQLLKWITKNLTE